MEPRVPFNKPLLVGAERDYLAQVLDSGCLSGDGPFTARCARFLERRLRVSQVLMTPSCTAALEMAAMLCRIGPGDEAILPAWTYVSTALAVVRGGGHPVFVDIRPDTLNIDPDAIEAAITPRTKAIFAVHYAGVACDMHRVTAIAQRHRLPVIEDAAQGVNAYYHGQALGSLGALGAFSFHETKNFTCGEGGALCVNHPALSARAELIYHKGTNRGRFLRGEVSHYEWSDCGGSYAPSELASAFLYAQLEALDRISDQRGRLYQTYLARLQPLANEALLQLPVIPPDCRSNHHVFHVLLPNRRLRDGLQTYLAAQGIAAALHYSPLHTSPMGRRYGGRPGQLPITESVSQRLLRLPLFNDMSEDQQDHVIRSVEQFHSQRTQKAAA